MGEAVPVPTELLSRWRSAWGYPHTVEALACNVDEDVIVKLFLQEDLEPRPASVADALGAFEKNSNPSWAAVEAYMALPVISELEPKQQEALQERVEKLRRRVILHLEGRLRLLKARASDISTVLVALLDNLDFADLTEVERGLTLVAEELSNAEARECVRLEEELSAVDSPESTQSCIARASLSQDVQLLRLLKTHLLPSAPNDRAISMLEELIVLDSPNLWPYRGQSTIASVNVLLGITPQRFRGINVNRWLPNSDDSIAIELLKRLRDLATAPTVSIEDCVELLNAVLNTFAEVNEVPRLELCADASGLLLIKVSDWSVARFLSEHGQVQILTSVPDFDVSTDYSSWLESCRSRDCPLVIFDIWQRGLSVPAMVPKLTSDDIFSYLHRREDRVSLLVRRILHLTDPQELFKVGGTMESLLSALWSKSMAYDKAWRPPISLVRLIGLAGLSQSGWMPTEIAQTDWLFLYSGGSLAALQLALRTIFFNATRSDVALRTVFRREAISALAHDRVFNEKLLSLAFRGIDITNQKVRAIMRAVVDWVYVTDGSPFAYEDIISILPADTTVHAREEWNVSTVIDQLVANSLIVVVGDDLKVVDRGWAFYQTKMALSD
jgi:hypothetical protein